MFLTNKKRIPVSMCGLSFHLIVSKALADELILQREGNSVQEGKLAVLRPYYLHLKDQIVLLVTAKEGRIPLFSFFTRPLVTQPAVYSSTYSPSSHYLHPI